MGFTESMHTMLPGSRCVFKRGAVPNIMHGFIVFFFWIFQRSLSFKDVILQDLEHLVESIINIIVGFTASAHDSARLENKEDNR